MKREEAEDLADRIAMCFRAHDPAASDAERGAHYGILLLGAHVRAVVASSQVMDPAAFEKRAGLVEALGHHGRKTRRRRDQDELAAKHNSAATYQVRDTPVQAAPKPKRVKRASSAAKDATPPLTARKPAAQSAPEPKRSSAFDIITPTGG